MCVPLCVRFGSNAGKFTPKGVVTVDALVVFHDGVQYVTITVSNTRSGAPMSDPESCFIPFRGTFQGKTNGGGSGALIGLCVLHHTLSECAPRAVACCAVRHSPCTACCACIAMHSIELARFMRTPLTTVFGMSMSTRVSPCSGELAAHQSCTHPRYCHARAVVDVHGRCTHCYLPVSHRHLRVPHHPASPACRWRGWSDATLHW